jgi:hypothetical protein
MFKAVGVGARKTDDGIEVTVSIQRDDGTVLDPKRVYRGVGCADGAPADRRGPADADECGNGRHAEHGRPRKSACHGLGGDVMRRFADRVWLVCVVVAIAAGLSRCGVVHAQDPALTELEDAQRALLQARTAYAQLLAQFDQCKAEQGQAFAVLGKLRADRASTELTSLEQELKASIERGHPGYTWDPKTGAFTKKPDAPK